MSDTDPFCSTVASGMDSVQSTVTSATGSEFLHLSHDTLTTDDEGLTTDCTEALAASSRNITVLDSSCASNLKSASEIPAPTLESIEHLNSLRGVGRPNNISNCDVDVEILTPGTVLEVPPPPVAAPDGGWGWVIVVVSFLCSAVVDGLCSVFGILLPSLVIYYEQSSSRTALAGSLLAGGFLLFGMSWSFCHLVGSEG